MIKAIVGGHWSNPPEGWVALSEQDQDLTAPLKWADETVDVLMWEHVSEHLEMTDCILFFKEAKRVLKLGGILRTVAPFVDKLVKFDESTPAGKHYTQTQLRHYYPNDDIALKELGIDFNDHGLEFMLDSLLKKHHHKHVWSTGLMVRVLEKIGYSEVTTPKIGQSFFDQSNCLERTIRGMYPDWCAANGITECDFESMVVEARK